MFRFHTRPEKIALLDESFPEYGALEKLYFEHSPTMQAIKDGQPAKTGETVVKIMNTFYKALASVLKARKDLSDVQHLFLLEFVKDVNVCCEKAKLTVTHKGNQELLAFFQGEINKSSKGFLLAPEYQAPSFSKYGSYN